MLTNLKNIQEFYKGMMREDQHPDLNVNDLVEVARLTERLKILRQLDMSDELDLAAREAEEMLEEMKKKVKES